MTGRSPCCWRTPRTVLAVLGPTASGKSALGLALAERYDGEIVNCDSTAVYHGFDIGTDKVPAGARRIMPRDRKRLVRALEVYLATGRPLTDHFSDTRSPIADCRVIAMALRLPAAVTAERVARRVDEQFARGVVEEVRALLARGVPPDARPFGGLVYRQVMEMLRGVRGEAETRELIVRENRRYARRQLIWFRKEPNLIWFDGPGERDDTLQRVEAALEETCTDGSGI